jgi:hypothetical protein
MTMSPDDTSDGAEAVRVDAPPAPSTASASVTSAPVAPAPPKRSRRSVSSAGAGAAEVVSVPVDSIAAPAAEPVAEPTVTGFGDDEETTRPARRTRPARAPATRPSAAGRTTRREFNQTVVKVDLWSVTKLSLCFYLSAMFVTIVALIALWVIADAAGIIHSVEKFLGDLLSAKNFKFLSGEVLRGTILVGLVVVAVQVVITVVAASFYNIFAELFGGLEITVREEDASQR